MSLKGKTVLLFGAGALASGYAPLIANEAENIVIVSRGDSCDKLADMLFKRPVDESLPKQLVTFRADASNFDEVWSVYDETIKRFGRIDGVVNGAGGNKSKFGESVIKNLDDFIKLDPKVQLDIMNINFWSKKFSIQNYARILQGKSYQGSVVNISSMSGCQPLSKVIDYSSANAALESLKESTAFLFGKTGIGRVNNIAVGFTIGDQNRRLLINEDGTPTKRGKEILEYTSQSRFLDPSEIGPYVVDLLDSDKSRAINGHTLKIDGGFNLVNLAGSAGYVK